MSDQPNHLPVEIPTGPPPNGTRWRGFNLCSMFRHPGDNQFADMFPWEPAGFRETDFKWIADWGFNCVRLPLCWRIWSSEKDPTAIDEREVEKIDRAVRYGEDHGLHVILNLHDAPGFCVCDGPYDLWKDSRAQEAFISQWSFFAGRYRHISPAQLSFNLLNEPSRTTLEEHARVMRPTVAAIRSLDADRPIVLDGIEGGGKPCSDLLDLDVILSCRGYLPIDISHRRAWWVPTNNSVKPDWPIYLAAWSQTVNIESLRNTLQEFLDLARSGVPVICGETGAYNQTPHPVFLAWLKDYLTIFREENIGFLLWNFRGSFGVLDSGRSDVNYEPWYGHQLDRRLLELLRDS